MTTTDHLADLQVAELDPDARLSLDLGLDEAEALRAWLLKASADGRNSLDEPLVSGCLTKLGRALDTMHAISNVRRELAQTGLGIAHLSDEHVRDLGRRVSEAAQPAIRA
jgi:hypothetical protein